MSTGITIEAQGIERLQRSISRLSKGLKDLKPLLKKLAAVGESQTRRRIESEKTAPGGAPWAPLTQDYKARKAEKSSGGILELGGGLLDSLTAFADHEVAGWGTNVKYAAIHQFGGLPSMAPGPAAVPERPYLGVSPENLAELLSVVDEYVEGLLG